MKATTVHLRATPDAPVWRDGKVRTTCGRYVDYAFAVCSAADLLAARVRCAKCERTARR